MPKWFADNWAWVELRRPPPEPSLDKGEVGLFCLMWTALGERRHLVGAAIQGGTEGSAFMQTMLESFVKVKWDYTSGLSWWIKVSKFVIFAIVCKM